MNLSSVIYGTQFRLRQRWIGARCRLFREKGPQIDTAEYSPRNVVFILAGLIGDSVMSTPAIIEARRIWPVARITVIGKKHNRELLGGCSYYDDFYEVNPDPLSIRRSQEIKGFRDWLNGQGFDAAIILLGDQYAHLLANANIPVRVGVKGSLMEGCLTHAYDIGSPRTWGSSERLNALRCLAYDVVDRAPMLGVEPTAARRATEKLEAAGLKGEHAVIHPFGSTPRQWWDLARVGKLAKDIEARLGIKSVLVGGDEVHGPAKSVVSDSVIDVTGRLSLPELLAVIDGAKFVVSTDSGPLHIAGALGKKTVGLFRSRRPEHANAYPETQIVFGDYEACKRECEWDLCRDDPCRQMRHISVDSVLAALRTAEIDEKTT